MAAAKLAEAADKTDPVAIKELPEQLKQARSRIDELNRQVQGLELDRAGCVPK
jgi:hypothetical protein